MFRIEKPRGDALPTDSKERAERTHTGLSPKGVPQRIKAQCFGCMKEQEGFLIPDGRFICPECHPEAVYLRWAREYAPIEQERLDRIRAEESKNLKELQRAKDQQQEEMFRQRKAAEKQMAATVQIVPNVTSQSMSSGQRIPYDPSLIHEFAERLYRTAYQIQIISIVVCALFGIAMGMAFEQKQILPQFIGMIFIGLLGCVFGYWIGRELGFSWKLKAQLVLCQAEIERNTRPSNRN